MDAPAGKHLLHRLNKFLGQHVQSASEGGDWRSHRYNGSARSSALVEEPRFARDSPLEGDGFELVWGFSCQVVIFGLLAVLCSEREKPFFVPSLAIRFAERAEGVKGPKR
jgi:hypothetical protein